MTSKDLSCGLDLPFSAEKVRGTPCQITGDDFGMQTNLGFTEEFSGCFFFFRLFDWKKIFTMRITPR